MKFTTFIPTSYNDGTPVKPATLERVIRAIWQPFKGMTKEGPAAGYWIDEDGTEFADTCFKISVECHCDRLQEAIQRVKRAGRKLGQRAMYFEVSGYDGVQVLRIE